MRLKLVHVPVEGPCVTLNCFLGPSVMEMRSEAVQMCPRYPEPVPLDHPLPILKEALEKVCGEEGPEGDTALGCFSPGVQGRWWILLLNLPGEGGGELRRGRMPEPRNGCVKLH